jgi:hypothetical protein
MQDWEVLVSRVLESEELRDAGLRQFLPLPAADDERQNL